MMDSIVVKPKRGLRNRITKVNFKILEDIYQNGVLTFDQVYRYYFSGRDRTAAVKRMTKLFQSGYLVGRQMGNVYHQGLLKGIRVIYQITPLGIRALREGGASISFREAPIPLNTSTLFHDVLLVDVIKAIQTIFPLAKITNCKHLFAEHTSAILVPDAVVEIETKSGRQRIAVELELTPKSDRRYRHLTVEYATSQDYECVIYVTQTKEIENKIRCQVTGQREVSKPPYQSTGTLFFIMLKDLLDHPSSRSISNGEDSIDSLILVNSNPNYRKESTS
ncbi:replication-relaxation family protein [Bdellovibrionota bacterium FG-2]